MKKDHRIEIYMPRLQHVIYVEHYNAEIYGEEAFGLTTHKDKAKLFEKEDALRISNLLFADAKRNGTRMGLPKNARVEHEVYVYAAPINPPQSEFSNLGWKFFWILFAVTLYSFFS